MPDPIVTLVVVPRERFSLSLSSLRNIYENTDHPFSLVYVDGNSPRRVREQIEEEARRRHFEIIRSDHYLFPNQARNIGFGRVKTKYAVLIENDVFVAPGWLDALVRCAEETGAAAVGPLYFHGRLEDRIIHMAGGLAHIREEEGRRICYLEDFFQDQRLDDLETPPVRQETELLEFHCILVRKDALDLLGGFDEGFMNTREHIDFCMALRGAGEKIYIEPAAQSAYMRPPPFAFYDLPFFMLRWSERWTVSSLEHYHRKWNLNQDETDLAVFWTKKQRYRFLEPYLSRLLNVMFRLLGRERFRRLMQITIFPVEGVINRLFVRDPRGSETRRHGDTAKD